MRITIIGAGGVGCYYGAILALGGHKVTMVGRAAFVKAVTKNGLILEKGGKRFKAEVAASTGPSAAAGAEMVLICVKSRDTEEAAQQIARYVSPSAYVLSLQNGITNAETLTSILGRTVLPVVVFVASRMNGVGVVRHEGGGRLELSGEGAGDIAKIFNTVDIKSEVVKDMAAARWSKLAVNCALNPLSAITRLPYGRLKAVYGIAELMEDIAQEVIAVATAKGIAMPENVLETIRIILVSMPEQYSSTAQDLMRGRRTEIDYLNGEIVRRAATRGIAVPLNRTLTLLVKIAEQEFAEMVTDDGHVE